MEGPAQPAAQKGRSMSTPQDYVLALDEGTVDVMLGGISITDAVLADESTAGSYLIDGAGI